MAELDLTQWKEQYSALDYCFFPLKPGSKKPLNGYSWKDENPPYLWKIAPKDSNIAIKCGGKSNLLVLDCDEKECIGTYNNISNYLSGLGIIEYPIIQTASRIGRHIYLKCNNSPSGSYKLINPDFGAGEVRFGEGSYIVAPPSIIIGSGKYQVLSGYLGYRPYIDFEDIRNLINEYSQKEDSIECLFERTSRTARQLLFGYKPEKYQSRSEQEQALIVCLINSGFEFEDVLSLFLKHPTAGKFKYKHQTNSQSGINYLLKSYNHAKEYAENNISEGRKRAIYAMNWGESRAWKGRTGSFDKPVYLAHARLAYKAGKENYHASCRSLAEESGMSIGGVNNANKRLIEYGFIEKVRNASANLASIYSLVQTYTLPQYKDVRECISTHNHDVFRYHGLGKSGCEIWQALQEGPKSIKELVNITGRHRTTIKRKLEKMGNIVDYRTGEIISMVSVEDDKYSANSSIDLEYVAELIGTKGIGARQKEQHIREREEHNRQITHYYEKYQ